MEEGIDDEDLVELLITIKFNTIFQSKIYSIETYHSRPANLSKSDAIQKDIVFSTIPFPATHKYLLFPELIPVPNDEQN